MISIGVIDTYGFVGAVEALDTCLKTADVSFVKAEKVTGGIISFIIKGDVAAVSASVTAGVEAAKVIGGYRHHTIIARVDEEMMGLFKKSDFHKKTINEYKKQEKKIDVYVCEPCIEKNIIPKKASVLKESRTEKAEMVKEVNSLNQNNDEGALLIELPQITKESDDTKTALIIEETIEDKPVLIKEIQKKQSKENEKIAKSQGTAIDVVKDQGIKKQEKIIQKTPIIKKTIIYSEADLKVMTVSRLRKMALKMNLKNISNEKIRRSRKAELIENIISDQKEIEE